jgi:CO/xanthine dehydrogenase FAD-binding subunit
MDSAHDRELRAQQEDLILSIPTKTKRNQAQPSATKRDQAQDGEPVNSQYESPTSIADTVGLLVSAPEGSARILAGGTDLLAQMRNSAIAPELLIDIKKIPELRAIAREPDGGFRIGAAVTGAELGEHPELSSVWPGIVEATELIGSVQIQGRASLGGNLCNASPAADSVPALIAAAAICTVAGPKGERTISVDDVVIGPGQTSLAPGEFIVDFRLPARPPRSADAYLRMIPRSEMDIAIVGVGVSLTLDDSGQCTAARVALGAVAATQLLVTGAAEALIGTSLDTAALEAAAAASSAAANPIDDKRGTVVYRRKIAGVLTKRAAQLAAERARS